MILILKFTINAIQRKLSLRSVNKMKKITRVALRLANCDVAVRLLAICRGRLSVVIARLMSKCL